MAPGCSIQAFYPPSSSPSKPGPIPSSPPKRQCLSPSNCPADPQGYGSATDQFDPTLLLPQQPSNSNTHQNHALIGSLVPGPQNIVLIARIVNVCHLSTSIQAPRAGKGCFKIIIKDDTGALTVNCLLNRFILHTLIINRSDYGT